MTKKTFVGGGAVLAVGLFIATSALAAGPAYRKMGSTAGRTFTPPVAAGTVSSVNGNSITITGKNGTIYTVDATNAAIIKNATTSAVSAIANSDMIAVFGTASGTNITATRIIDGVMRPGMAGKMMGRFGVRKMGGGQMGNKFSGSVTAINGTNFTLTARGKAPKTLTVNDANATFTKNGQADTSGDLALNQSVLVTGTADSTGVNIIATKVNIVIPMPAIRFSGTVQSVSGGILTVLANNGTSYTVDATSAVVSSKAVRKSTLSVVQVGDKVAVAGKLLSGSVNVTAGSVRDTSR